MTGWAVYSIAIAVKGSSVQEFDSLIFHCNILEKRYDNLHNLYIRLKVLAVNIKKNV